MLCQNCKEKQATFHYKSNNNGSITETHLCSECASKMGYTSESGFSHSEPFSAFDGLFDSDPLFGGILGNMLGSTVHTKQMSQPVCSKCGMRYSDFAKHGKLGCAECYKSFADYILPTVKKIHGNTAHNGKAPKGFAQKASQEKQLSDLKAKLSDAVAKEDYESAAKYRDEIRAIENSKNNKEGE